MTIQSENSRLESRRVVAAAIRNRYGDIIVSARHFDNRMRAQIDASSKEWDEPISQGFIDQYGIYLTREDAWVIASNKNQIIRRVGGDGLKLFSENLY